jgi:hypothetical protein
LKTFLAIVAAILVVLGLSFVGNALNLWNLSFWGPKFEEANRQIVQQSIRRQEGVSNNIGALCLNMKTEKDPASKSAFANLIVQQATGTGTTLTADAQACVADAKRNLNIGV